MKNNFYLKSAKWAAAYLSCLTMVFAPVAMGKEAEEMTQKSVQQLVKDLGLDKKMTLGEFWEKNKALVPGYVYRDLENFVKQNKNMQMPEVTTDVSKATDGSEIPVLRFTKDGKTQTAQIFGEKEKWVKFNGVTLTERDLERVEDVFKRIEGSDIKLKRKADKYRQNKSQIQKNSAEQKQLDIYKKDFARFNGFPRVTPQMWKSLTKEQRVGYIVKMRLMWMNARKVLAVSPQPSTAVNKSKLSAAVENFYKVIFGEQAYAKPILPPPPGQVAGKPIAEMGVQVRGASVRVRDNRGTTRVVSIPYNADTCVVAGYIGAYGKVSNVNGDNRAGCSIDLALATYKNNPSLEFVQKANEACAAKSSTMVACNPIIYGYPNGAEACIDRKSNEYQHATHFSSPSNKETCDGKSRLASNEDIIKFNDKDYSNVQPREKQIQAIEADQQKDDYALTNSYLKGVLTKKDGILAAMFEKGEWNLALDEELVKTQLQFEEEIDRAIKTCEADFAKKQTSSGAAITRETNQKLACDQLHRRWLFTERAIAKLRDKACLKPALYIGNYNGNESSYADSAKEKTALNKRTIDAKGTGLCECPSSTPTVPVTEAVAPTSTSGDVSAAQAKAKRVSFGEKCEEPPAPAPEPVPAPPACSDGLDATKVDGVDVCACKNNAAIFVKPGDPAPNCEKPTPSKCDKPEGIAGFNYEQCKCDDGKKLKFTAGDDGGYECEGKNWLPWVLGGLGILALLFFFFKKKKKDPPPVVTPPGLCPSGKTGTPPNCVCANTCSVGTLNPTTCGCDVIPPASCTPPKEGTPPACTCPAAPSYCTPPQKIYDANTCQCTDVPQPPTCADGSVAPGGNISSCPTCPDGSYRTTSSTSRPGGCPAEGGGGNNCPQGGCSGGLPGTGN